MRFVSVLKSWHNGKRSQATRKVRGEEGARLRSTAARPIASAGCSKLISRRSATTEARHIYLPHDTLIIAIIARPLCEPITIGRRVAAPGTRARGTALYPSAGLVAASSFTNEDDEQRKANTTFIVGGCPAVPPLSSIIGLEK
jgi:hypothetical protein